MWDTDSSGTCPSIRPRRGRDRDSSNSTGISGFQLPACRQCRARKVKCDRVGGCCGPCTRLALGCSYSSAGLDNLPSDPQPTDDREFTQAGIKRRRTRCACLPCRTIKAKCSGEAPCARCQAKNIECVTQRRHNRSPRQQLLLQEHSLPSENQSSPSDARGMPTPLTSISSIRDPAPPAPPPVLDRTDRALIEAYFNSRDSSKYIILHPSTTLAEWSEGDLESTLVRALCAAGLHVGKPTDEAREKATAWLRTAQSEILSRLDILSLPRLQALLLIILNHYETGNIIETWHLLAIAARGAFTLKLNYEQPGIGAIAQETRRRLMWQIYYLDRICSGGLCDLEVCPVDRLQHLRLPCEDRTFERGMPSRAEFLTAGLPEGSSQSDMDIHSFILRLYASRDRILRYTKQVCRQGVSPILSKDKLSALETELDTFAKSLPDDIQLNSQRLPLMAQSRDSAGYLRLHTVWLQCYCDLYRFLVPGLRESVSFEALSDTPEDYVSYCQQSILAKITLLCDTWTRYFKSNSAGKINDIFLGISCYQVSQIIDKLQHVLIRNHAFENLENIKCSLRKALDMIDPAVSRRFVRLKGCLREAEQVVQRLGKGNAEVHLRRPRSGTDANNHHLISKGSMIPRDSSDSDEANHPEPQRALSEQPEKEPILQSCKTRDLVPGADLVPEAQSSVADLMGSRFEGLGMLDFGEVQHEFVDWDSFSMELPHDCDPELGILGLHTRI